MSLKVKKMILFSKIRQDITIDSDRLLRIRIQKLLNRLELLYIAAFLLYIRITDNR